MRVYLAVDESEALWIDPDPAVWEDSASDYDVPDELVAEYEAAHAALQEIELRIVGLFGFDSLEKFHRGRMLRIHASIDQDHAARY